MKALGRGLDALIGIDQEDEKDFIEVKITDIDPNIEQPRKQFSDEKIQELSDSIKNHGLVQPILVVKNGTRYKIVAGERRWRASKLAGLKKVPVIVKELTEKEQLEISLIENLQRQDLNPIEEAITYKKIIEKFEITQEEMGNRIGKSRVYVTNIMRLMNLDERVKQMLINEELTYGHAKTLLSLENKEDHYKIALLILEKGLNVRDTEKLIRDISSKKEPNIKVKLEKDYIYKDVEEKLREKFNTKVSIVKGQKKGKIEIEYYSNDDLDRILESLM